MVCPKGQEVFAVKRDDRIGVPRRRAREDHIIRRVLGHHARDDRGSDDHRHALGDVYVVSRYTLRDTKAAEIALHFVEECGRDDQLEEARLRVGDKRAGRTGPRKERGNEDASVEDGAHDVWSPPVSRSRAAGAPPAPLCAV